MNKTNFNSIAGYEKEKEELLSLAQVLKDNKKLKSMGGKMPRGLMLVGDNGVGKSVLANAFIQETGLSYVSIDHKYKDEKFTKHVSEAFKKAAEERPAIILIEEIDKIAAQRDMYSFGSENYERFNVLLSTINEYAKYDDLFILATANKRMRVDYSLVRSGRIDSIVNIGLPNQSERQAIFEHYSEGKKLEDKIDYKFLAKGTAYFSGADIETVMNEAVIIACKNKRNIVQSKDIESAINNKKFGRYEKDSELSETYQRVVATHEAGHALMMLFGPNKNISRVTILPRGSIRGYAEMQFQEDKMQSITEKENLVCVALGGLVAEKVFYKMRFDGADSDMGKAQSIIHSLICDDGVEGYGLLVNDGSKSDDFVPPTRVSQKKLELIEQKESELFDKYMNETTSTITRHKKLMNELIQALMSKKVLEKEDLETLYNNYLDTLDRKEKTEITKSLKEKYDVKWNGQFAVTGGAKLDPRYI